MRNASAVLLLSGIANSPLTLDFGVRTTQSTLVPQIRWIIPFEDEDFRRAGDDTLRPLIFFVNWYSWAGSWLSHDYRDEPWEQDYEAPFRLRGGATTHIRINQPSQWPSYSDWMHDITARDLTNARSPAHFMNCIGTSVDEVNEIFNQYTYVHDNVANARRGIGSDSTTQRHVQVIGVVRVTADTWVPIIQFRRHLPSSYTLNSITFTGPL